MYVHVCSQEIYKNVIPNSVPSIPWHHYSDSITLKKLIIALNYAWMRVIIIKRSIFIDLTDNMVFFFRQYIKNIKYILGVLFDLIWKISNGGNLMGYNILNASVFMT
jgi:hypothetical protein